MFQFLKVKIYAYYAKVRSTGWNDHWISYVNNT